MNFCTVRFFRLHVVCVFFLVEDGTGRYIKISIANYFMTYRNELLHRYDSVNSQRVWEAVQKLAVLKAVTEALIVAQPDNDDR